MSEGVWTQQVAQSYDDSSAAMYAPEVLGPTVDFLAGLTGGGRALALATGTGRVAVPLAPRGVEVVGIELSEPRPDGPVGRVGAAPTRRRLERSAVHRRQCLAGLGVATPGHLMSAGSVTCAA